MAPAERHRLGDAAQDHAKRIVAGALDALDMVDLERADRMPTA